MANDQILYFNCLVWYHFFYDQIPTTILDTLLVCTVYKCSAVVLMGVMISSTPFLHLMAEILFEAKMMEDFLLFSSIDGGKVDGWANWGKSDGIRWSNEENNKKSSTKITSITTNEEKGFSLWWHLGLLKIWETNFGFVMGFNIAEIW